MSSGPTPPGYNTPVPTKILTPDQVDTRIGPLEFADGVPPADTAARLFDHLDFLRAVEVFLNCVPAASMEALRVGLASMGADACHNLMIMDQLLDSDVFFLTGNADTVYCDGFLDLEKDGPTVVEIPAGCGPLSRAEDPPTMEFRSDAGLLFNTVHANDVQFYDELAPVIHRDPIDMIDPETRDLLAAIGIHKDRPFAPDIVFGPEEPAELATNWIQTVPGKGWFVALRLYGPLDAWFDQTWRPGDVELDAG
jgi:hypothetical protein